MELPFIPHEDPRIWDSTDALELKQVPERLLVIGGGIIGLEMGTVTPPWVHRSTWLKCSTRLSRQPTKTSLKSSPSAWPEIQPDAGDQGYRR
ncbi:FAD-dependent oxidoreductase [Shigella flexneri]